MQDIYAARVENLEFLENNGVNPYPSSFKRSHKAYDITNFYDFLENGTQIQDRASVCGRIMAYRNSGMFMDLRDDSGKIQIFCHKSHLSDDILNIVKKLDLGDFIGVSGFIKKTQRGEISIAADKVTVLSKSLSPLPDKRHGIENSELRYRKRYLDMLSNEEAIYRIKARSLVLKAIRANLDNKGYIEVETPMLHPIPGGATAKPFTTFHNKLHQEMFLRIAPELYLKRMIVGGFESVYEINRCFRNEGLSTRHNPEFTTLEMYEAYTGYEGMIESTKQLIRSCAYAIHGTCMVPYKDEEFDFNEFRVESMIDLVRQESGFDFTDLNLEEARITVSSQLPDSNSENVSEASWGRCVEMMFEHFVEHTLIQPTFVTFLPKDISPLAKSCKNDPRLTERFELYINGWEIANGFSELNDPRDQRERFEEQMKDKDGHAIDEDFLEALSVGLPPTGGMGMGIDRLVMLLTDAESIKEVIAFPMLKNIKENFS